jgi:hypothetical protein
MVPKRYAFKDLIYSYLSMFLMDIDTNSFKQNNQLIVISFLYNII